MKPLKKIQLEIYPDKTEQFYLSLLKYKLSGKADLEILKAIADAIHLDKDSLMNSFELSEEQRKKINDQLFQVHAFLLKSRKDSEHYFTVSKENIENFLASPFGKELQEMFFMVELIHLWKGKADSTEIKTVLAMIAWFIGNLMNGLTDAVGKSLSMSLNTAHAVQEASDKPFNVKPNEKGNLVYESGDESIEVELFIEKDGHILKKEVVSIEDDLDMEINSFFMKIGENIFQVKEGADTYDIILYDNAIVKNKEIDLSKSSITEKISIPKNNSDQQGITAQTIEPIDYNHEEMLKKQDSVKQAGPSTSIFEMLQENFSDYLTLPGNNPRKNHARDKMITGIYELLLKHYPDHTLHFYSTITGYIASRIGLLDSEEAHDETKRLQSYRKYLRDTVYNILKGSSLI